VPIPSIAPVACDTMSCCGDLVRVRSAARHLADTGRALLCQYGPPLGFLATVRRDGGPRLHPFCPIVSEGGLWAYIQRESPKGALIGRADMTSAHITPHPWGSGGG